MTDNDRDAIAKWSEAGTALAAKVRERLQEIENERAELMLQLQQLEAPQHATAGSKKRGSPETVNGVRRPRSPVPGKIVQILTEAGATGMRAGAIVDAVRAETDDGSDVDRGLVLTHLSRLKRRGAINASGNEGDYVYSVPGAAS